MDGNYVPCGVRKTSKRERDYSVHDIYCLFTKGGEFTRHEGIELVRHAYGMKRERKKRRVFRVGNTKVDLRTEFKDGSMGTIFGTIFTGRLNNDDSGEREIRFLVRHRDPDESELNNLRIAKLPFRSIFESDDPRQAALN